MSYKYGFDNPAKFYAPIPKVRRCFDWMYWVNLVLLSLAGSVLAAPHAWFVILRSFFGVGA